MNLRKYSNQQAIINLMIALMIPIFVIGVLFISVVATVNGIDKSEKAECIKWKEYSEKYPDFYYTGWQKAQCEQHEIY